MARQQDPPPPGRLSASWSSGQAAGLAPLDTGFYDRPVLQVAPELLGALVQHAGVTVRLTEVEAYDGANDPGSHAFRGATPRTAVMFGPPGRLYVYFSYGMHYCANLVCGPSGTASAVLLRAGEVVEGIEAARARRCSGRPVGAAALPDRDLARGPARLTQALRIGRQQNGSASTDPAGALRVCPGQPVSPSVLRHGPRVGVAGAGGDAQAYPWRFWLDGEATVSAYRPAVRRTPARQPVRGAGRP